MIRLPLAAIAGVLVWGVPLFAGHDCPLCSSSKSSCECKREAQPKETLGPGEMPCQLEGVWKITLCIECRADHVGHTWLRYERCEEGAPREVHTVGRYWKGHGGARGVSGVQHDEDRRRDALALQERRGVPSR